MHKIKNNIVLKSLARHFREIRRDKGFTQQELADKSGVTLSQIARIETAKINTTVCTLHALSKAMDIGLDQLLQHVK
jgi:transcriptional regulator with XRE-family HTH domain